MTFLSGFVSQIGEGELKLVLHVIVDLSGKADSSVLGEPLYPRCHVHSVAGNVAITQLVDRLVYGVHVKMPKSVFR